MHTAIESHPVVTRAHAAATPRFDLYGPIHKAIRFTMSELLVEMGKTSFADPGAAGRVVKRLGDLLVFCEQHIEHEERFIHPALAERSPGALETIEAEHAHHAQGAAELRSLSNAVDTADTPERRALAGRTLYLHYSAFFAETLAHMVEEERVLQPLLHRLFSDGELLAIHGAIVASMEPSQMIADLSRIVPAVSGPERAAILGGVHANAPPRAFEALVASVRSRLDGDEWSELVRLAPFVA